MITFKINSVNHKIKNRSRSVLFRGVQFRLSQLNLIIIYGFIIYFTCVSLFVIPIHTINFFAINLLAISYLVFGIKKIHAFENLYSLICITNLYLTCLGTDISKNSSCYKNLGLTITRKSKTNNTL